MAEKEERILIGADIESPCVKCKEIDFCDANCEQYEKFAEEFKPGALKVLYRQEAINRMAKAICKFEMMTVRHICKDCDEECFDHLELEVVDKAEAALNALLSKGE